MFMFTSPSHKRPQYQAPPPGHDTLRLAIAPGPDTFKEPQEAYPEPHLHSHLPTSALGALGELEHALATLGAPCCPPGFAMTPGPLANLPSGFWQKLPHGPESKPWSRYVTLVITRGA
jgi:hypothetical protein